MEPRPKQIEAALFLVDRRTALLASEQRTGKTGSTIIGAELANAKRLLVITTKSGRAVWHAAFATWAPQRPAPIIIPDTKGVPEGDTLIVSWAGVAAPRVHQGLRSREWDLIVADESHYASSPDAKRTQALYGSESPDVGLTQALCARASRVWALSGTPAPNAPCDLHPLLRALAPERLLADDARGWKDVSKYDDFLNRYCKWRMKKLSRWRSVRVVMGGQNVTELKERCQGFWLRHTQKEVGIQPPAFEMLPLTISEKQRREIEAAATPELRQVLKAADAGETRDLEMHFGPLRRLTGGMKAIALAELVRDELNGGMRKVVLMSWHVGTVELLAEKLQDFGAVVIHGGTSATGRAAAIQAFQTDSHVRVASCQMVAAGEAIDLSASDELIFCESSFVPQHMSQAALRITNLSKNINTRVRVACLAGSIDEPLQLVVARKITAIRALLAQ